MATGQIVAAEHKPDARHPPGKCLAAGGGAERNLDGDAGATCPSQWSVTRNQNIVWRTTLPEEGQSGIAVWGNRLFLTTMKPLASANAAQRGA